MNVLGLTGGIACGKSTVAKTFEEHNIPNVDADLISRDVVNPGTIGLQLIVNAFGTKFLNEDGTLNRILLGDYVFSNSVAIKQLNDIMLPLIQREAASRIEDLKNQGYSIVIYNAALLCETGNAAKFKPLIVVGCSEEIQLKRLMKRNSLSENDALKRIKAQMPSKQKITYADYVIDTSSTITESKLQTERVIRSIKKSFG